MATTSLWHIEGSLNDLIKYVENPDKTVEVKDAPSDLSNLFRYVTRDDKTQDKQYVTAINCVKEIALKQMIMTKKQFNKTTGYIAWHGYQSFKPNEVTPEQCHKIGVQLAKEMWGDRFQVIVTTHLDKDHLHNHFCINSVSFIDGKKYDYSRKEMQRLRETSDRICWEHDLSIVKNPSVGTPRAIYEAEKRGEPTKYNLMREAIDFAVEHSVDMKTFHQVMREQGYEVNLNQNRTYWTIKRFGDKKATRMFRLGEEYNHRRVQERIKQKDRIVNYHNYRNFMEETKTTYIRPRPVTFRGSFKRTRRITGLKALYFRYCYLLGFLPEKKQRKPLSPEMREAWRRIDRYSQNIRLICKQDFKTTEDVSNFIASNNEQIKVLEKKRNRIRARMNRTDNPAEKAKYKAQRDDITTVLTAIRKDNKTAKHVLEDSPKIKEDIAKEQRAMQQRFIVQQRNHRSRRRNYEWEKTR